MAEAKAIRQGYSQTVLWRGPKMARPPNVKGTRTIWAFIDQNEVWLSWVCVGVMIAFLAYQNSQNPPFGLSPEQAVIGVVVVMALLAVANLFHSRFAKPKPKPKDPAWGLPLELTEDTLRVPTTDIEEIAVSQIHHTEKGIFDGALSLELHFSDRTLTLITSERDSLFDALNPLIPNRETTP